MSTTWNKIHTNNRVWVDRSLPAVNAPNLNDIENCLEVMDNRIITLQNEKADASTVLNAVTGITYNTSTGVFVFTWENGNTLTADLNVEKIPVSFSMDANGIITMTTADGTEYTCDLSDVARIYTFSNSSVVRFNVTNVGNQYTVTADIVDGSITASKLQPNFLADCVLAQQQAQSSATAAGTSELKAEGYAVGKQDGVDVPSTSPYYHNNAKFFSEQSQSLAHNEATNAEAYAIGTRDGVPVGSTDPAYHNNALYWKDQAQAVAVPTTLASLTDVGLSNLLNGQILVYNSTTHEWENKTPTPGAQSLSGLTDVEAVNPTNGQVLSYNSTIQKWENGKKLPFDLAIDNNAYGYINGSNEFVAFKSQADIDAAVSAAKVGNAAAGDVLSGKTFTNNTTSGVTGSMTNNGAVDETLDTTTTSYTVPEGYHDGTGTVAIETQTKSATPTTSAQTITPDTGKVLSSVSVGAIQTQTKSVTPTTSAQTVTPDSGKYLTSVSVGTQAHSDTFTASSRSASLDMGATHNYRYIDTTGVPGSSTVGMSEVYSIAPQVPSYHGYMNKLNISGIGYNPSTGTTNTRSYNPAVNSASFAVQNGTISMSFGGTNIPSSTSYPEWDLCTYNSITFTNTSGSALYVTLAFTGYHRYTWWPANTPPASCQKLIGATVPAGGTITLSPDTDYVFATGIVWGTSASDSTTLNSCLTITTQVVP